MQHFNEQINKGKAYAIFEDHVVDMRFYPHPGGTIFLQNTIG